MKVEHYVTHTHINLKKRQNGLKMWKKRNVYFYLGVLLIINIYN